MNIKKRRIRAKEAIRSITGHITFGETLRNFREIKGYSQVECSKLLGITKQELCNIEKGRKFVSVERAVVFAKALKIGAKVFVIRVLEDELYRAGIKAEVIIKSVA